MVESRDSYNQGSGFIRQAVNRGIDFGINQDQLRMTMAALGLEGDDPWKYISSDGIAAERWAHSTGKMAMERVICGFSSSLLVPIGLGMMGLLKLRYGLSKPVFDYKVGFLGLDKTFTVRKLQTLGMPPRGIMWEDANPLITTTFSTEVGAGVMNPLGGLARGARSFSVDEMLQVPQVARGRMGLIGLRAWGRDPERFSDEVGGLGILYTHLDDPEFRDLLGELAPFLRIYPLTITGFRPEPAIMSHLSAANAKKTHGANRVVGDLLQMKTDSPRQTYRIGVLSIRDKLIKRRGSY